MKRWPPYAAGAGIGVLSWFAFATVDRPIGVSTAIARTAGMIGQVAAPDHVAANPYFVKFRPAVDWNKGRAIRQIAADLKIPHEAVVFLGDDVTDEDAFRELGPASTTIHVGSAVSPSLAQLNAGTPCDVAEFLRAISGGLEVVSSVEP